LAVKDLAVSFRTAEGRVRALDGVTFDVPRKSNVALVGESGSGKTVTAQAILRLLPSPPATIERGRIELDGEDLLGVSERRMRAVRGGRIALVFQDAAAALDPVYTVGAHVMEALRLHVAIGRKEARRRAVALLERVGMPEAERRFSSYPHELSGGMKQRALIATAIACEPALVIADEPTTALDMIAASHITALLADLQRSHDMSLLLISHDVALVGQTADHVVVLYAGQVAERGPARELLERPRHPYTRGLLASVPPLRTQRRRRRATPTRLPTVGGAMSDGRAPVRGCRFADRCPEVLDRCREESPPLYDMGGGAAVRCFLHEDDAAPVLLEELA
jgi:oligopeptide/dipeptide ABC transporter ATP-binding protein